MIVYYKGKKFRAPDFFVGGAPRCGTTWLYRNFIKHKGVFLPDEKEPMFFCSWGEDIKNSFCPESRENSWMFNNHEEYSSMYKSSTEGEKAGDFSTWYLYEHEKTIKNIKEFYGERADDLRFIFILRNPVLRIWSHYCHKRNELREHLDFRNAIAQDTVKKRIAGNGASTYDYIGVSMYSQGIRAYMDAFKHLKIFIFEEMFSDPQRALDEICSFLNIDPVLHDSKKSNISGVPKNRFYKFLNDFITRENILKNSLKPFFPQKTRQRIKNNSKRNLFKKKKISEEDYRFLEEKFTDDIRKLEKLLGRDLKVWKR